MGLMYAKYPHLGQTERAVKLVASRQLPVRCPQPPQFETHIYIFVQDGSWATEALERMFNRTIAVSYPNFKFSFMTWMLGEADSH